MAVGTAVGIVGACAGAGAGLGVVGSAFNNNSDFGAAALNGAVVGTSVATLGGLLVAIFSAKNRETALETAGIGLGALIVERLL
jgi:hypothetical protein